MSLETAYILAMLIASGGVLVLWNYLDKGEKQDE